MDEIHKQHMVTLRYSGVMIFYLGEPRMTASINGRGWKVPEIRSGPYSMLVSAGSGPKELQGHPFPAGCLHSLCPSIYSM